MKIEKPGIYNLPDDVYHADPCPSPSLSSSIANMILEKSPLHAWHKHPRLNPHHQEENRRTFDIGTACHALVLLGDDCVVEIDASNYKTKAAQEARDAAYALGKTPLLEHEKDAVEEMAVCLREQLDLSDCAGAFYPESGPPERTIAWRPRPNVWGRCKPDWLDFDSSIIYDLKTTGGSAHPDAWARQHIKNGPYGVQAAWYRRGVSAVLGWDNPQFRFVVQESKPPYAISLIDLTPAALHVAEEKVDAALNQWAYCLEHDRWPGYPPRVVSIDAEPWELGRWEEIKERETDARAKFTDWQAPLDWDNKSQESAR